MRRWKTILLIVVLLVVLLVALLPRIAGAVARGPVQGALNDALEADVTVDRLALRWFGDTRVDLSIDATEPIGDVRARTGSLLALLTGSTIEVDLAGDVHVRRDASGRLNILEILPASDATGGAGDEPAPTEPPTLPRAIVVNMDDLAVTWHDAGKTPVRLDLAGSTASVAPGATTIDLEAKGDDFSIVASVEAPDLVDAQRRLHTDADFVAKATLTDVPGSLVESYASQVSLPPTVTASLDASRTDGALDASFETSLGVSGSASMVDGVLRTARVEGTDHDLLAVLPDLRRRLDEAGVSLADEPDFLFETTSLALDPANLEGVVATGALEIGRMRGSARDQAFDVQPMRLDFSLDGFDAPASASTTIRASVGGEATGVIEASASVVPRTGRVDRATATITDFATVLLQPFIEQIDLERDIGPTLSLRADATTTDEVLQVDLRVTARRARVEGGVRYASSVVSTDDLRLELDNVGSFLSLAPRIESDRGAVTVTISHLHAPIDDRDFRNWRARGDVTMRGVRAVYDGHQVDVAPSTITVASEGEGVQVTANVAAHLDGVFAGRLEVDARAHDAFDETGNARVPRQFDGSLSITGAETRAFQPWVEQLPDALGERVTIEVTGSATDTMRAKAILRSPNVNADVVATVDGDVVTIDEDEFVVRLRNMGTVATGYAPVQVSDGWARTDGGHLTFNTATGEMGGEVRFALGDFEVFEKMDGPGRSYGRLARLDGAIILEEHPRVRYVATLQAEGETMRSEANIVVAEVPHGTFSMTSIPMALAKPYAPADVLAALPARTLSIDATVQADADRTSKIMVTGEGTSLTLEGDLSMEAFSLTHGIFTLMPGVPELQAFLDPRVEGLSIEETGRLYAQIMPTRIAFDGMLGDLTVNLDVDRFAVRRDGHLAVLAPIEAVLKKSADALVIEGLESTVTIDDEDITLTGHGVLGEASMLSLNLAGESKALAFVDERLVTALGANVDTSLDVTMEGGRTHVKVRPGATNLSTDRALQVLLGERLLLEEPWIGTLMVQPELVTLLVPDLKLARPTPVKASLFKLDRGETLDALTVQVEAPAIDLGAGNATVAMRDLVIAGAMKQPDLLGYRIEYDEDGEHTRLQGEVQLAGTEVTRASMHGVAPAVPTTLIDALIGGGGMLAEALGPVVWVRINAQDLKTGAASITLTAESDRAKASLKARNVDGVATLEQPLDLQITKVTPTLTAATVTLLPLVGNVEKQTGDAPARIYSEDLVFPVDLDWSKLNGTILLDPGEARFSTSTTFGRLLNLGNTRVGRRLEPLMISITDGVARYDPFTLPLGEFEIQSEGSVNLVDRTVDIVTYVPLGALSDEIAGIFNTGLGSALPMKRTTMVPLRTKGQMGRAKTEPDVKLFLKQVPDRLKPQNLLNDLLKGIG